MLYVVGPNCGKRKKTETSSYTPQGFVDKIREIGSNMMRLVTDCNTRGKKKAKHKIEVLRVCLVSGGVFRHPGVSKVAVAEHLMCGMLEKCDARVAPALDFAMDDGVFE